MKTQTFKPPALTEHEIQNSIIATLAARKFCVVRFNSGSVKAGNRFVRFYLINGLGASAGLPDVIAFRGDGGTCCQCLMVEVKDAKGKLTESQQRFHEFAGRFGITVHTARSWEDVAALVEDL